MNMSGALQWENWEAWPEQNQQCYVESPRSVPCAQGRVSLYSAEVESAAHIQAAVNFAVTHNVKLVIKNTGHDFLGRSSAPDSLQISTYKMKNITVINSFVPSVPSGTTSPAGVKAITLGAGVQQHEMYTYLATQGAMVVGGSSNTVGIAGGYIQGGGHSIMGWIAGMASDNALEFKVVTASVRYF
jgi:FAD/FMN-containing dehydrogenase